MIVRYTGRVLAVMVQHRLKRNGDALAPIVQHHRAWPADCDSNLHLNNGRYLYYMDMGRAAWLGEAGFIGDVVKRTLTFLLAGSAITFRRPIDLFERFSVETRLATFDERWFVFEQTFFNARDQVAATALARGTVRRRGEPVSVGALLDERGRGVIPPPSTPEIDAWLEGNSLTLERIKARDG